MTSLESVLLWSTMGALFASFAFYLVGFVFGRGSSVTNGWRSVIAAATLNTGTFIIRWISSGHPPVQEQYELALFAVLLILWLFIVAGFTRESMIPVGLVIAPASLFILGLSYLSGTRLAPLGAPYKSVWMWIHVGFAWIAFAGFVVGTGLAVSYLLKEKFAASGKRNAFLDRLPDLDIIDDLSLRFIAFGFIGEAFMIVSGAVWAIDLWGSFWSWDPVETWSLICWLVYGLYLHLRITRGWRGRRAAWLAVGAIVTLIISTWGVRVLPSVHVPII